VEGKMSAAENRSGLETPPFVSLAPGESKKMEKKSYIESLRLKNNARPLDEEKIIDTIRRNEGVQFERIGMMFDEIAEYYGDK
jgi:hypothetical protein